MKELLRGLSLFANVGIAEAFMESIGVNIRVANELDPTRAKFYQDVYPNTHMICGDITDDAVRNSVINEAIRERVDFIIATPPCQGMSEAGLRREFDARNQLVYYAVDAIKRINPRFAFLENVPKQLTTKIKLEDEIIFIPEYIKRELGDDYRFNQETLIIGELGDANLITKTAVALTADTMLRCMVLLAEIADMMEGRDDAVH